MRLKKSLLILTAVMLPLATIGVLEGTAFAGKVTGAGMTTCSFGGTISFDPPLTKAGSTSIKKETTTVSASLGSCTGGTPAGPAGASTVVKPIKSKTAKGKVGGSCGSFTTSSSTATIKATIKWPGEKPTKFSFVGLKAGINTEGEVGFTGSFPVTGSYAGTGNLAVFLNAASSNAIVSCSSAIHSLTIDRSSSSGKL